MKSAFRLALGALCFGLAGLLVAGHCDAAEKKLNMRLGHPMNKGDQVSLGCLKFSELLEEKSGGKIKLKVYGDCILGSDRVTTEGAQKGSLSMSSISTSNLSLFAPDFLLFDMPYIIDPMDPKALEKLFAAMDNGPLGQYYEKVLNSINLKLIYFGELGFRAFQFHNKNVSTIEGLKNVKVRVTDSVVELAVAKALGMYPIPMAWGETITAMRQGTVDAMGANTACLVPLGDIADIAKYIFDTKHNYTGHVVVMNLDLWKSLTDGQRAIIEEAAAEAVSYERSLSARMHADAYGIMKEKGVTMNMCSESDFTKLKELTKPVWEEFRSKVSPEAYALFMDALK